MLFVSSYMPLYALLIMKNILERCTDNGHRTFVWKKIREACFFDEVNDYAIACLALLLIISMIYLIMLTRGVSGEHWYKVISIEDQTGNSYLNYISIYLLSCFGLTLNSIVDVFVLAFLMIVVGYVYISNYLTYMNPVLQFMGYRVYEGYIRSESTQEQLHTVIVAKKNIRLKEEVEFIGSAKEDFVIVTEQQSDN